MNWYLVIIGVLSIMIVILLQPHEISVQDTVLNSGIAGLYDPYTSIIYIDLSKVSKEEAEHIFLHEFGHYLDMQGRDFNFKDPRNEIIAEQYANTHQICGVN